MARRKLRRRIAFAASAMSTASLAAAGLGATGALASVHHKSEKTVTITFWDDNGGPRTPIYEHLIPIFERRNPGIKVKYVGIPDTSVLEKYDTAIQGGSPPDVGAVPGSDLAAIIAQNALVPLNKLYEASAVKGQLLNTLLSPTQAASPDGKTLYALPFSGVPSTLWCNMNVFRAANLTCPTTWDGFFTDAKKLTDPSKGVYGFTMRGSAGATIQMLDEMISYAGLGRFWNSNGTTTLTSPHALDFLQRFVGLYKTATPSADVDNAYLQMVAEFDSGKIGMMLHNLGSYASNAAAVGGAQNLEGLAEPASPFLAKGHVSFAAPGIDTYAIFKKSPYQAQDWKFIQFLVGAEANGYWNKIVGQMPANSNVLKQKWVQQQQPVRSMLQTLSSKDSKVVNEPLYLPQFGSIVTNMDPMWQEVMLGQMTPSAWLGTLVTNLDQAEAQWTQQHK